MRLARGQVQTPATQRAPPPEQARPQVPQFPNEVWVSTQLPLQQESPLPQTRPQAPQLLGSTRGLTQALPHIARPLWQAHDPPTQPMLLLGQVWPQVPQ